MTENEPSSLIYINIIKLQECHNLCSVVWHLYEKNKNLKWMTFTNYIFLTCPIGRGISESEMKF